MKTLKKPSSHPSDFGKVLSGYLGHHSISASTSVGWTSLEGCLIASGKLSEEHVVPTPSVVVLHTDAVKIVGNRRWARPSVTGNAFARAAELLRGSLHESSAKPNWHGLGGKANRFENVAARRASKSGDVMLVLVKEKPEHSHALETLRLQEKQFAEAFFSRLRELSPVLFARTVGTIEDAAIRGDLQTELDALLLSAAASLQASKHQSVDAQDIATVWIDTSATDPLQAARDRGKHQAVAEWEKPENLPLKAAAEYAGRSDRVINEERQRGRLYALVLPGKERGYRYPQWQFDVEPERMAAVLAPFIQAGASCWVIHSFLHRQHEALDGVSPRERLLDATYPIEHVVAVAAKRYLGDQGAG